MTEMTNDIQGTPLVLPLTDKDHEIAHQLAAHQPTPEKATQVQLNILAVSAVHTYLEMMDIPTDLEASDSRNSFLSLCNDVADLVVTDVGRLECRPVSAQSSTCRIPAEVWEDRIGYIAVQMDEALEEATLIGFTPTVQNNEEVPLRQFQPLRNLLRRLHELKTKVSPESASDVESTEQVNLSQLLQGVFVTGWQTLEQLLLGTGEGNLAYGGARRSEANPVLGGASADRRMGKLISLEQLEERQVVLLVESDAKLLASGSKTEEIDIVLRVIPANRQGVLPTGLQLIILDELGTVVRQTEAEVGNDYLRLPISGRRGEQFGVTVSLVNSSITESFVI